MTDERRQNPPFKNAEDQQTAGVLSKIILASLSVYLILLLSALYAGDTRSAVIAGTVIGLQALPLSLIKNGKVFAGSIILMVLTLGAVTVFATIGQGIRDIAIVVFPVIYIFAGLSLNRWVFRITIALSIVSIAWLAFGEKYGWYTPIQLSGKPGWPDFILAAVLLAVVGVAISLLTTNLHRNIRALEQTVDTRTEEINQLKRAEEALRKSEVHFKQVIDNVGDAIYIIDSASHRIIDCNLTATSMLGYTREEILKLTVEDIESHLSRDEIQTLHSSLANRRFVQFEARHKRKDGTMLPVEINLCRFDPLSSEALISSVRDITERKNAIDELIESERNFRRLFENSVLGISEAEPDGRLVNANDAYVRMYGYNSLQQMMTEVQYVQSLYVHPESREKVIRELQVNGCFGPAEFEVRRRDGTTFWVLVSAQPIKAPDGSLLRYQATHIDITDRKNAAAKMEFSEERFRLLAESSLVGFYILQDGKYTYANPAMAAIFGYSVEEFIGLTPNQIVVPDDQAMVTDKIKEQFSGEVKSTQYQVRVKRKNGSPGFVEVYGSGTTINGKPALIGTLIDVTDRKRVEAELEKSNIWFRAAFMTGTDAYLIATRDEGRIVEVNDSLLELYGYKREEMVGRTGIELGMWAFPEARQDFLKELRKTGIARHFELLARKKSGETFWVLYSASELAIPGEPMILGAIEDTTKIKLVNEMLKENEAKFRSAFMTGPDAFYLATLEEGLILEVNDNFEQVFDYPRKEVIGKTSLQLNLYVNPADRTKMVSELKTKGFVKDLELKARKKCGEIITISISISTLALYGKDHILGIIRDITERKQAEAESLRLREKAEMSSRLAAVGEMAAGIAHEINNPLTSVIGYSELLMDNKSLPEELLGSLKIIYDGSQRVKDIVKRMLTFARQTDAVKTSVSVNELIENTLSLRSYVLRTANVRVNKNLSPAQPMITADPGQMHQVFLNLIVNAEYSMKQAHGKGVLSISTTANNGSVDITITDDGTGMSEEVRARLFNPFFTTKAEGEGTGLGLALSRAIILEHGGTIDVESQPGDGASFIIKLPLSPTEEVMPPQSGYDARPSMKPARTAKIMVVDDEEGVRKYLTSILSSAGHVINATGNPGEALNWLKENNYDVILLDIRMPGMGGMEMYTRIKTNWPEMKDKIIFITGDTSDANTKEFLEKNNVPSLLKPFDKQSLLDKVNKLL